MTNTERREDDRAAKPLSPAEIVQHKLPFSGIGRRGYRVEEVDDLRMRLAREVDNYQIRIATLIADAQDSRDLLVQEWGERGKGYVRPREESEQTLSLLMNAQKQADAIVAEAQRFAQQIEADAEEHAHATLVEAQQRAETAAEQAGRAYREEAGASYNAVMEQARRYVGWLEGLALAVRHAMVGSVRDIDTLLADFKVPPELEVAQRTTTVTMHAPTTQYPIHPTSRTGTP